MADLQLEIEGEGAVPASEELLQFEGLSGTYTVESDPTQKKLRSGRLSPLSASPQAP
jgi:hypothetical protein